MDKEKKILLEESCLPPVESGEYCVTADVDAGPLGKSRTVEESFRVDGPRFRLNREDIVSVFPGSGIKGRFGQQLPHIVLGRKTLPWERSTARESRREEMLKNDVAPTRKVPWLFVLLLHGEECVSEESGRAGNVISPPENVFFPELYLDPEEEDEECGYIDLPRDCFEGIMPSEEELALLVHARQISEDSRQNAADEQKEWVSVAVGNRLPLTTSDGGYNKAYLVSMEGFAGWKDLIREEQKYVRMIVLYSWEFYSVTEGKHFLEICHSLDAGRLQMTGREAENNEKLRTIEEHGYRPLPHYLRQGSRTVSFYRGPLSPEKIEPDGREESCWCADQLYRYDPESGTFDVSYAAAWQLGRILALNNGAASREIAALRTSVKNRMRRQRENAILQSREIDCGGENGSISRWLLDRLREKREEI